MNYRGRKSKLNKEENTDPEEKQHFDIALLKLTFQDTNRIVVILSR